jgi:hypothetical protein
MLTEIDPAALRVTYADFQAAITALVAATAAEDDERTQRWAWRERCLRDPEYARSIGARSDSSMGYSL